MRHMHFDQKTLEERSLMPGKFTAILPTSTAPMEFFCMAVLSLLCRSEPSHLEHLIVTINGPDERTGDPSLQDEKERWLRRLLRSKWCGRDMPLTIQRTLSRVGHAQALESAAAWVHTEFYLSMHDDVIVLDRNWSATALAMFERKNVALISPPPLVMNLAMAVVSPDKSAGCPSATRRSLVFPHLSTFFTMVRKAAMLETGARWPGYHLESRFSLPEQVAKDLRDSHAPYAGTLDGGEFDIFSQDIGAWVKTRLESGGHYLLELPEQDGRPTCIHFSEVSWGDPAESLRRKERHRPQIETLKAEVLSGEFRKFWE